MNKKTPFSILSNTILLIIIFYFFMGISLAKVQQQESSLAKSIETITTEAEKLVNSDSLVCVQQGKRIYENLLLDKNSQLDKLKKAYIYEQIGDANFRIHYEKSAAIGSYEKALSLYNETVNGYNKFHKVRILYRIGTAFNSAYMTKIEREKGIRFLSKALKIARQQPKRKYDIEAAILTGLSEHYYFLAQQYKRKQTNYYQLALRQDKEALLLYRKAGDIPGEVLATINVGWDYFGIKYNYKKQAIGYLKKGLELAQKSNDERTKIKALVNLGDFSIKTDLKGAEEYFIQALNISKDSNNKIWQKETYQRLIEIYQKLDKQKGEQYQVLLNSLKEELKEEEIKNCTN